MDQQTTKSEAHNIYQSTSKIYISVHSSIPRGLYVQIIA